jgi:hypothetical protein
MFSPQLFEMLAPDLHAERIEGAQCQRLASGNIDSGSGARTRVSLWLHRQLAQASRAAAFHTGRFAGAGRVNNPLFCRIETRPTPEPGWLSRTGQAE